MHRLRAIYVDFSNFKWRADLYLFVRLGFNLSDFLTWAIASK
jgi:hypothetical protein